MRTMLRAGCAGLAAGQKRPGSRCQAARLDRLENVVVCAALQTLGFGFDVAFGGEPELDVVGSSVVR